MSLYAGHEAPAPRSLRSLLKTRLATMLNLNAPPATTSTSTSNTNTNSNPQGSTPVGDGVSTPQGADSGAQGTEIDISVAATDPVWKVLIYDQAGQAIISPILKVNNLREQGVTVHMQLYGDRQPIPEVPAVYFVQATRDNVRRIAADLRSNMYDAFYVNFVGAISRELLEELAAAAVESGAVGKVAQVYDQYLDFVCNEANFFSLQGSNTYELLNSPRTTEAQINSLVSETANSIFSVLATLKAVPIIRCQKGGAAEMIGRELESRLRDQVLNSRSSLFAKDDNVWEASKPVLILFDRNIDYISMLTHTWTYAPLIHDAFDMRLGRIQLVEEENGKTKKRTVDVDQDDFFWRRNMFNAFPQVAEEVDMEINKYKSDVDKLTKSCGVNSLDEINPGAPAAMGLTSAIKKIPALTERKRILDIHMSIATGLLKVIQARRLDELFENEEAISKLNKASLLQIIKDGTKNPEDKVRFFAIFYLSAKEEMPQEEFNEYINALQSVGANEDVAALKYLVQVRAFSRMSSMGHTEAAATDSGAFIEKFTSKFTDRLKDAGVHNHFENLLSGVKNLLPSKKEYPVTKVLGQIMEQGDLPPNQRETSITGTKTGNAADEYVWLDPYLNKSTKSYKGTSAPPGRGDGSSFTEAIVFAVGGGNYLEYQNLLEYMEQQASFLGQKKRIVYGSTELVSPTAFLQQLKNLGPKPVQPAAGPSNGAPQQQPMNFQ